MTAEESLKEIENLLRKDNLLAQGVDLDIVRDVTNVLADRRLYLQQRNEDARFREIVEELQSLGFHIPLDATVEQASLAFKEMRAESLGISSRMHVAEGKLRAFRSAFKRMMEE